MWGLVSWLLTYTDRLEATAIQERLVMCMEACRDASVRAEASEQISRESYECRQTKSSKIQESGGCGGLNLRRGGGCSIISNLTMHMEPINIHLLISVQKKATGETVNVA